MSNLIPVFTGILANETTQLVNARELHSFLVVGKDFSNWIKDRISQYGFIENQDYLLARIGEQMPSGTKYKTEYHITLNMAKELSMVERNDQGKQARRYFIDCEKALLESKPKGLESSQLHALQQENTALLAKNNQLQDKYIVILEEKIAQLSKPKPIREATVEISADEIAKILELHAQGQSGAAIAKQLNRSTAAVSYIIRGAKGGAA